MKQHGRSGALQHGLGRAAGAFAWLLLASSPARAQLPSAATAGLGMADNYTAVARGYNATRWNPANLGLLGGPAASLAFFPVRGIAGLDPITPSDISDYAGRDVPHEVRLGWLERIRAEGREQGSGGAEITYAAAQFSRIAFQVGSAVHAVADLPTGAAQLLLFGNVGPESGEPVQIVFDSAALHAVVTSTVALAYAQPFSVGARGEHRISVGVTAKYTLGHFMLTGEDEGSRVDTGPIEVDLRFPTITTDTSSLFNNGSGLGFDLGVAWQRGIWTAAATLQNVFNSFEWKQERLRFRPARAIFNAESSSADFQERSLSMAPEALRQRAADLTYKPVLSLGAAAHPDERLLVSADFRTRLDEDGMTFGPRTHAGVGAEYRVLPWLPVRAGFAVVTDGTQIAGGFGIDVATFSLAASVARRSGSLGHDQIGMVTLISSWPRPAPR